MRPGANSSAGPDRSTSRCTTSPNPPTTALATRLPSPVINPGAVIGTAPAATTSLNAAGTSSVRNAITAIPSPCRSTYPAAGCPVVSRIWICPWRSRSDRSPAGAPSGPRPARCWSREHGTRSHRTGGWPPALCRRRNTRHGRFRGSSSLTSHRVRAAGRSGSIRRWLRRGGPSHWGRLGELAGPNTRLTLWPPKANEFDSAAPTGPVRAGPRTWSRSQSGSGSSRL